MAAVGGSIESVSLDGREFAVTGDAEAQRKLGGFENEVMANGNGTARIVKTRVPLAINGLTLEVDDDRGDHEFLQSISDSNGYVAMAITYASGLTYQGQATIVGELQASSKSTASVNLSGPGVLTKQ